MRDITKLPKWAQELIADQGREIERLEGVINDHAGDPEGADITIMDGMFQPVFYAKGRSMIRIQLADEKRPHVHEHIDIRVKKNGEARGIRLTAGFGQLVVRPESTNVLDIDAQEYIP